MKPLPKIQKCVCGRNASMWSFYVRCNRDLCWIGPTFSTRRAAILAWNRVMKRDKRRRVWVVEMLCGMKWQLIPVATGISREDARRKKTLWEGHNPDDRFRVRKYVREERS